MSETEKQGFHTVKSCPKCNSPSITRRHNYAPKQYRCRHCKHVFTSPSVREMKTPTQIPVGLIKAIQHRKDKNKTMTQ